MVDPHLEPDTDGPSELFTITLGGRPVDRLKPHDTEKAAKAELAELRKELSRQWTVHRTAEKAFQEATEKERRDGQLVGSSPPQFGVNHWKDAEVTSRTPIRTRRINRCFLCALHSDGSIQPWAAMGEDVFANDWSVA